MHILVPIYAHDIHHSAEPKLNPRYNSRVEKWIFVSGPYLQYL